MVHEEKSESHDEVAIELAKDTEIVDESIQNDDDEVGSYDAAQSLTY